MNLYRLVHTPPAEWRLLVRTTLLLWVIRLALWFLPFKMVRRGLRPAGRGINLGQHDWAYINRVTWAVRTASRFIPVASCLTQALAVERLLRGKGLPANVFIGVARREGRPLEAHAWVESAGRVVIGGGANLSTYTVLVSRTEANL